jgi:hypothetical protein
VETNQTKNTKQKTKKDEQRMPLWVNQALAKDKQLELSLLKMWDITAFAYSYLYHVYYIFAQSKISSFISNFQYTTFIDDKDTRNINNAKHDVKLEK